MGMDTGAVLIVGLDFWDMWDFAESLSKAHDGDFYEGLDSAGLTYACPWYDCPPEFWVVGIEPDIDWDDTDSIGESVRYAKNQFKEITGKYAKVIITQNVW